MDERYKVDLPEGESGPWKIERFTVTEEDEEWGRLRAVISSSSGGRFVPAGTYTGLKRNGGFGWEMIMSDTPDEIGDHLEAIRKAKQLNDSDLAIHSNGAVHLVNGIGLGMVISAMLEDGAEKVIAVEKSSDVIALVAPTLQRRYGDRFELREADALEYRPPVGERYGVVWHDIWDGICSDNLPEMHKLHRKYGRRCEWQGSWSRGQCERQLRYSKGRRYA